MSTTDPDTAPVTVVLGHGAFTDASSWNGVIERLQAAGVQVMAPPNPLRGLSADSAYIRSFVEQIPGPVLLVGHSYTGAVISDAGTDAKNVVGLVFVAAFATDEGETVGAVAATSKDAILSPALVQLHYPVGDGGDTAVELGVDPARFAEVIAAGLPAEQTAVMAATQRPIAAVAFSEPCGPPAWKSLPSWAIVATGDKAAGADLVRSQAERAGAAITEIEGPHVIMISQPEAVANVIMDAVGAVAQVPVGAGS
jgi:pimeloyl-ACP methyl ester carboxylesterase